VFLGISFITGVPEMDSAELGSVAEGYPAYGNLQEGDVIVSIEGESVENWDDVSNALNNQLEDRNITFTVLRDGNTITEQVTPILYFYSVGFHSDENAGVQTIIGDVPADTKADAAGFQKGDKILTIDGETIVSWTNVVDVMSRISNETYDENRTVDFEMERDGTVVTLTVDQPFSGAFLESQGVEVIDSYIGIGPVYGFDFIASIQNGFLELKASALLIFTTIQLLFDSSGAGAGIGVGSLAGPVGIFEITARALEQGLLTFFSWIGLLSVNLGVINLLPIPALDGGRLVFLGYEAVTRRKPNKRIENTLHYVMYLALMGLFVYITFNDILRLFNIR
jgi:regulator of sigma E protease